MGTGSRAEGGRSAKSPCRTGRSPISASARLLVLLNDPDGSTRAWARARLKAADELGDLDGPVAAENKSAGARSGMTRTARGGPADDYRRHLEKVAASDPDPLRRLRAERVLQGRKTQ